MAAIKLTEKEQEVFLDIFRDQYSDGTENCRPWSWSVVNGSKSRAGVLSSLVKKGLVNCEGVGHWAICWYTESGKWLLSETLSELLAKNQTV